MPAESVDGMDVLAVEHAVRDAAARSSRSGGPMFLEFRTYRFRAHSMFDAELYRDKSEVEKWKTAGSDRRCSSGLLERTGALDDAAWPRASRPRWRPRSPRPWRLPKQGTWEPVDDLTQATSTRHGADADAIAKRCAPALREALTRDPRVFLMGEDVGRYGGAYAVSKGLLEEFGPERIRDTPLSESTFVGAGIGAALGGMRPIVEVMTVNFSLLALDQIVNNAATIRHMSGGQFSVPLVIRMATGAGRQLAAQHAHSFEGWFAHIPGLRIAHARDARGRARHALVRAADPDPVLIFEHQMLYNMEGELRGRCGRRGHRRARRSGGSARTSR